MPRLLMIDMGAVWGGQEIYSLSIMRGLVKEGWDVVSLSSQRGHSDPQLGVDSHFISNRYSDFFESARLVNNLQGEFDVIHFNGIRAIYFSLFCRKKCLFVGTKHSPYAGAIGISVKELIAKLGAFFAFLKIDKLIVVSNAIKNELPFFVRNKSCCVMNGVADIGSALRWRPASDAMVRICFVGRFFELKGVMRLIEAVTLLVENGKSNFLLSFAGAGPLETEMKRYASRFRIDKYVEFLGFLEDPSSVYLQSDICVLPSVHEGLPLSLLEAMSAGCSLIGHDVPGVADVIENGVNGLIVEMAPEALAEGIGRLLDNVQLLETLRNNSRRIYEEKWTLKRMLHETKSVYVE